MIQNINYTTIESTVCLQHRLFTPQYGEPLDCSQTATNQVINTLRIVETAINEAIKAGSESIKLAYINIPDPDRNPDGMLGGVRVVGYRTKTESERKLPT